MTPSKQRGRPATHTHTHTHTHKHIHISNNINIFHKSYQYYKNKIFVLATESTYRFLIEKYA
jgi:hypothetical protein